MFVGQAMFYVLVEFHGHASQDWSDVLYFLAEWLQMTFEYRVIDEKQRLFRRKGDVKDIEERNESRIDIVATTARLERCTAAS